MLYMLVVMYVVTGQSYIAAMGMTLDECAYRAAQERQAFFDVRKDLNLGVNDMFFRCVPQQ